MSISSSIQSLCYYNERNITNDFPSEKLIKKNIYQQSLRILQIVLPLINLYKPASYPLSVALATARTFTILSDLVLPLTSKEMSVSVSKRSLIEVTIVVGALVFTLLEHPASIVFTTIHDLIVGMRELSLALKEQELEKAIDACFQIFSHTLYLCCFFSISLELSLFSLGCKILFALYRSHQNWQKEHYLSCIAQVLVAATHSYQLYGQIQLYNYQKQVEKFLKEIEFNDQFEQLYPAYENSHQYDLSDLDLQDLPDRGIGYINGINNSFEDAKETAHYLSKLAGGCNIYGVYNASQGWMGDLEESKMALHYIGTEPVRQLHAMWTEFFSKSSDNAEFLMICHSQGAIHVRNALICFPQELREKITVIAIAPGAYIPKEICANVLHYTVQFLRDPIPYIDIYGRYREQDTTIELPSSSLAPTFDHGIMSPTYFPSLLEQIVKYINQEEGSYKSISA